MADKKKPPERAAITNRRARFEYEIIDKFEAGLELSGCEVKSLRGGGGSLAEAYAMPKGTQLFVVGMHIKPYEKAMGWGVQDPTRDRKLLLRRKEMDKLIGAVSNTGLTLIPLRVYFNARGWAKLELGLARGKKLHDKRDSIKERDLNRELAREYKLR